MALTDKQKRFADEYLIDLNATAAYLRAGYKCSEAAARSSASDLLTNPNIVEYIESKQKVIAEKIELSAEWVLQNLKYVAERCMAPEPLSDKEGNIIEWRFDSSGANRAIEMIGKHLGMFKDKIEHSGSITTKIDMSKLTVEELRNLAKSKQRTS